MRIALVDQPSSPTYPADLAAHLIDGGATVVPVDVAQMAVDTQSGEPQVLAAGVPLAVDTVVSRRVALLDVLAGPALALLEASGVWVCNPTQAASAALDKARTAIILTSTNVPCVATVAVACAPAACTLPALSSLTGPLVVKPANGGGGVGVVRVANATAAAAHIERLSERLDWTDNELVVASARHYVVQPLTGDGCDYRVFVLNGEAIACTRRFAAPNEFRTNGTFGSSDEKWSDGAVEAVAIRAAAAMGLYYAGVDVLVGPGGPVVLEVNGWAQFAHTERVTGVPIAQKLAQFLLAGRPE